MDKIDHKSSPCHYVTGELKRCTLKKKYTRYEGGISRDKILPLDKDVCLSIETSINISGRTNSNEMPHLFLWKNERKHLFTYTQLFYLQSSLELLTSACSYQIQLIFFKNIGFDVSNKLSPWETIFTKYQTLYSYHFIFISVG